MLQIKIVAVVAVVAGLVGWWCCDRFVAEPARAKLGQIQAVADAENARYRRLETEAENVKKEHVKAWKRERARADDYWMRLNSRASTVPQVPPVPGGTVPDQGNRVETSGGEGDRTLPRTDLSGALIEALQDGERLEAILGLCQTQLRACAGIN